MQRFKIGQAVTVHHLKPWKPGPPIQMRGRVAGYHGDRLILHREFRGPGHRGQRYDSLNALQRSGLVRYVDLEIDVSGRPGPPLQVTIHDAADLDRAVARGYIPTDLALVARQLAERLTQLLAHTPDPDSPEWDIIPWPDPAADVEATLRQVHQVVHQFQEDRLPNARDARTSKSASPRTRIGTRAPRNQSA